MSTANPTSALASEAGDRQAHLAAGEVCQEQGLQPPRAGVESPSKDKEHKRYEFGRKMSVTTTNKTSWVMGAKALNDRPYNGHTFGEAIAKARRIIGRRRLRAYANKGYRGAKKKTPLTLHTNGRKHEMNPKRKRLPCRRSSVELVIDQLKNGYRLDRNFLKRRLACHRMTMKSIRR